MNLLTVMPARFILKKKITWEELEKIGMKLATNPQTFDIQTIKETRDPATGQVNRNVTTKTLTKKDITERERAEREKKVESFGGEVK